MGGARCRDAGGRHAHRLSDLSTAGLHLDGARGRRRSARGRPLHGARQQCAPLVRHRQHRRSTVGAGQAVHHLFHRGAARTADAPHRRAHILAAADRHPLVGLILLEPDFGTSMSLVLIASVMVFAAGLDYRYIAGAALAALPALYILVMGSAYRRRRMFSFLNPWEDPLGDGFQIIQSLIAVGTGGIWGKGLMNGVQKLFYLPEPHTDFIYSVIAEELGLAGASVVLVCFCVVTWRGLRVALRAPDTFGALLALGLTTMVAIQAFVNISVVLGMMPTKGIPLPFVSAGGSSLVINLVGMGILLNVSQHTMPAEA
ncbi:MAG: hypothetical protein DMF97_15785 [Acidobacteria bacterium]|nr:MAG: hypothetical protein DMF97_15785 [Acidobacteriota bacterium]